MLDYLFQNATEFVSKVVQIYMDERVTRENLTQFLKLLNVAAPFLVMNDFRTAKALNMLQRIEFLGSLI